MTLGSPSQNAACLWDEMTLPPHPLLADCTAIPPETPAQTDGQTEAFAELGFPCNAPRQRGHPATAQALLPPLDRRRLLQVEGPKWRAPERDTNLWEPP